MSFGFGVGDFLAVSELAWNLYRYCYVVARGAPQEFQLLLQEITSLSQSIQLLQEEAKDPNSTLVRSGDARIIMVKEMMGRVEVTLRELEKHAKKYEKLGDNTRAKRKQIWSKFKWSVDATNLDSLRNKLVYHNGIINLLLTSCGNSSLQRIESSTIRLERRFSQIGEFIQKAEGSPGITGAFTTPLLSAKLMMNAEVGRRKWSAIGVDEWIQAGRWWLLKSQNEFFMTSTNDVISNQGYADLIKASWILIDVIARHPQLNLLESSIRHDAELLADAIRAELEKIDSSGIPNPTFDGIRECDFSIWVTQAKGPAIQPGTGNSWETEDENVLFQSFGHYQSNDFGTSTPCVVLFVAHKKHPAAQIIVRDQSWITLATFIVGKITSRPVSNFVHIGDQKIEFRTSQEAQYVDTIAHAVDEYIYHGSQNGHVQETLHALMLLFAVKNNYPELVARLLRDKPGSGTHPSSILQEASRELATLLIHTIRGSEELESARRCLSLSIWALQGGYTTVAMLLLDRKSIKLASGQDIRPWAMLHEAAKNGRIEVVRFILAERGGDIAAEDHLGRTVFELAARSVHIELAKELLSLGAVYREIYYQSTTIIQKMAEIGNIEMLELMIAAGADVNAPSPPNEYGDTALQAAAKGGHHTITLVLLEAGADVHANDDRALQRAAQNGHHAVVLTMLEAGADVHANDDYALRLAAENGHHAVVLTLLEAGADVHAKNDLALQWAARSGHHAVVLTMLEAGADVHAMQDCALRFAAENGHHAVVLTLLEAGADVHAKNDIALRWAASKGHHAVVLTMLEAGADVHADDDLALWLAAENGHHAVVLTLLEAGADVHAKNDLALQRAAQNGHHAVVLTLLEAGADVHANNNFALQWASRSGHHAVVLTLLEAGADVHAKNDIALQAAAKGGHHTITLTMLEAGADVHADDDLALRLAAENGHHAVVLTLLEAGADVHAMQDCALRFAAENGHHAVVLTLLEAGADVHAKTDYALRSAAENGHHAVVLTLLEAGADVHAKNDYALQWAASKGHHAVVLTMLEAGADVDANHHIALQSASRSGHHAVVLTLLEAGADVHRCEEYTSLLEAVGEGNEAVVERLFDVGKTGSTPVPEHKALMKYLLNQGAKTASGKILLAAVDKGNRAIIKRLLEAGANAKDTDVLQMGVMRGDSAVIKMLLEAGADVDGSTEDGATVLGV